MGCSQLHCELLRPCDPARRVAEVGPSTRPAGCAPAAPAGTSYCASCRALCPSSTPPSPCRQAGGAPLLTLQFAGVTATPPEACMTANPTGRAYPSQHLQTTCHAPPSPTLPPAAQHDVARPGGRRGTYPSQHGAAPAVARLADGAVAQRERDQLLGAAPCGARARQRRRAVQVRGWPVAGGTAHPTWLGC